MPVGSNHHNVVYHSMAFADMGIRSSALVALGAAPDLGTGNETDTVIERAGAGTEAPTDEGLHDRLDFTLLENDASKMEMLLLYWKNDA